MLISLMKSSLKIPFYEVCLLNGGRYRMISMFPPHLIYMFTCRYIIMLYLHVSLTIDIRNKCIPDFSECVAEMQKRRSRFRAQKCKFNNSQPTRRPSSPNPTCISMLAKSLSFSKFALADIYSHFRSVDRSKGT